MRLRYQVVRTANRLLHWFECRPSWRNVDADIVFIVGPPRSGTTLVYQLLTDVFDFGYVSNAHSRFFGGISVCERWLRPLRDRVASDYKSRLGTTQGKTAPHECGNYWYQFFPERPQYQPLTQFSGRRINRLKRSCGRVADAFGKPIVFKNVMNSARIQVLSSAFPDSVFVHVNRDIVDNAHSIMKAKQQAMGRTDIWWSLEPKGFEHYRQSSPDVQAVQQVKLTHQMIDEDLIGHDDRRVFRVRYEDLCDKPNATVEKLWQGLKPAIPRLQKRGGHAVPGKFGRTSVCESDHAAYQRLTLLVGEANHA